MPDYTDTSEEISASPAPQDGGGNVGSADSEILAAVPEAGADFYAPEAVDGAGSKNAAGVVENGRGAEEPVENLAPVSESWESAPEPVGPPDGTVSGASESGTAQIPVNEPLTSQPEIGIEPGKSAASGVVPAEKPESPISSPVSLPEKNSLARKFLAIGRGVIQFRKRKKLDRVMTLFLKHSKITNDEVEKLLHVSDATAARFLSELKKKIG